MKKSNGKSSPNVAGRKAAKPLSPMTRLLAALLYGGSSLSLMFVNKYVLTVNGFPSASTLALLQMCVTIVLVPVMKEMGIVSYPDFSKRVLFSVFPLPLIFLGNTIAGLMATKGVSIPMYACLRRFSIFFLMVGERLFLEVVHSARVKACVMVMLLGAIIAAADDLTFDPVGYSSMMVCNVLTASNGIVAKLKLSRLPSGSDKGKVPELGTWGLMFYNALWSAPILCVFLAFFKSNEVAAVTRFDGWSRPSFVFLFMLSCFMGTLIQLAIFYCTQINGPLTTGVVGSLKNIISTFAGMVLPGMEYIFSWTNFFGVLVSLVASLVYSYEKIVGGKKK